MNQQVNKIKNYEQRLSYTPKKLEPQYRLPTENSMHNASQPESMIKKILNPNQSYMSFLESITPQSKHKDYDNMHIFDETIDENKFIEREKILPNINISRCKSENKNNNCYSVCQDAELVCNSSLQKSQIQIQQLQQKQISKMNKNYNFYAVPKDITILINNQQAMKSNNPQILLKESDQMQNYRYSNTTKNINSNRITFTQKDENRFNINKVYNRYSTINYPYSPINKNSIAINQSIDSTLLNRLDVSKSQINQLTYKQMTDIKNIIKDTKYKRSKPTSYLENSRDFQIQLKEKDSDDCFRFSNQCFSTHHKNYKQRNSIRLLNKSYDYNIQDNKFLLNRQLLNQSCKLNYENEQNDAYEELQNKSFDINNISLQNRNHLSLLNNASNRYNKQNQIQNQQKLIYKNKQLQQQYSQEYIEQLDNSLSSEDSYISTQQSNHNTSFEKKQYFIDERKVVNIQDQNMKIDSYIKELQNYVIQNKFTGSTNGISFKKRNIIHPRDIVHRTQYPIKPLINNSNSDKTKVQEKNDKSNISTKNIQQDCKEQNISIHSEQNDYLLNIISSKQKTSAKENIQIIQNYSQQKSKKKLCNLQIKQEVDSERNENTYQKNKDDLDRKEKQIIQRLYQKQQDLNDTGVDSYLQSKSITSESEQGESEKYFQSINNKQTKQDFVQQDEIVRKPKIDAIQRQYSFSVHYQSEDKIESFPESSNIDSADLTPKLFSQIGSQEQTQIQSKQESPNKNLSQTHQIEDNTYFEKKRKVEIDIDQIIQINNSNQKSVQHIITCQQEQNTLMEQQQQSQLQSQNSSSSINNVQINSSRQTNQQSNSNQHTFRQTISDERQNQEGSNIFQFLEQSEQDSMQLSQQSSDTFSYQQNQYNQLSLQNISGSQTQLKSENNLSDNPKINQINLVVNMNQISLPGSQLQSHQTVSQKSSYKNSISQSFKSAEYPSNRQCSRKSQPSELQFQSYNEFDSKQQESI